MELGDSNIDKSSDESRDINHQQLSGDLERPKFYSGKKDFKEMEQHPKSNLKRTDGDRKLLQRRNLSLKNRLGILGSWQQRE